MSEARRRLGADGERLAAAFLARRGLRLVGRNVPVGGGELDVLAWDGRTRVAVEVRTVAAPGEPLMAFDRAKATQVGRLAEMVGAQRVDLVAVGITPEAAEIRWVQGVC